MCNLYSVTKGQKAIIELSSAMHDRTGNLPPLPGLFPTTVLQSCGKQPKDVNWFLLDRACHLRCSH
jgi:hypothetical protein